MSRKRKNLGGRPVSVNADRTINYRVDAETIEALEVLAARWNCSKSEAVRHALKKIVDHPEIQYP